METKVIHIRGSTGSPNEVYIGRKRGNLDGYFGNPFVLSDESQRLPCLDMFERYARKRIKDCPEYRERVKGLYGKTLVCFCSPKACHGNVLKILAEELNNK